MAEKKKLIDEAMLDIQSIQAVLKANTKEILRATMLEEINAVVKESLLKEDDYDVEDVDDKETDDNAGEELGGEIGGGEETPELPVGAETEPIGAELGEPVEMGGDDEIDTLDLTSASDDEVISVFKKLSGEDEIEIVSNTEVKIKDPQSGNEYIVKLGGGEPTGGAGLGAGIGSEEPMGEPELDLGDETGGTEEEPEYELNLGDETEGGEGEEPVAPETGDEESAEEMPGDEEEVEEEGTEGVVYEIELQEMEDISKRDGTMGKTHPAKELVGKGTIPKGNIEGQKAEQSPQYDPKGKAGHSPAEGIGSGKLATGKIDGQKAKVVDRADTNTKQGFPETAPSKKGGHSEGKGGHAEHVMETEDVTEEVEQVDELETKGIAQARRKPAGLTNIAGAGGKGQKEYTQQKQKSESYNAVKNEVVKRYNTLMTEVKALRQEREEFKANLGKFRDMLAEAVVYNSNLTHVVKLFTEHSTTKVEKENIMKRFDSEVTSLKESKKLYKTIVNELNSKGTITESVIDKTTKIQTSSASQLSESTAYVDASTKRIIDLIQRVETR